MRRAEQARLEHIPHGDLGDAYFRSKDYHRLAGGGWPDQLVWHSRDLVSALRRFDGGA